MTGTEWWCLAAAVAAGLAAALHVWADLSTPATTTTTTTQSVSRARVRASSVAFGNALLAVAVGLLAVALATSAA